MGSAFQRINCPDCGADVTADLEDRSRDLKYFVHHDPVCEKFRRRTFAGNLAILGEHLRTRQPSS